MLCAQAEEDKHQRLDQNIACEVCGQAEKELFPKVVWMVITEAVIQTSCLMSKHVDKREVFRRFQPAYQQRSLLLMGSYVLLYFQKG